MGLGIIGPEVVTVVGCHKGMRELATDADQAFVGHFLLGQTVFHDFEVIVSLSEDIPVQGCRLKRSFPVTPHEMGSHFTVEAGARCDEPVTVCPQQFVIHTRAVVKPFEVGPGTELHEVFVALKVFASTTRWGRILQCRGRPVSASLGSDVEFAAHNGFDALLQPCW